MEKIINIFKIIFSGIATLITWLFGGWDISILALIIFMTLDFALGITKGYKTNTLSSELCFDGIIKKSMIFIVLIVAVMLDKLKGGDCIFRTMTCYWFIANEGLSILENVAELGGKIPEKLSDALKQVRGESSGEKESTSN